MGAKCATEYEANVWLNVTVNVRFNNEAECENGYI